MFWCFLPSEPVDKVAAVREFRVLHTALHSSPAYRDAVSALLLWGIRLSPPSGDNPTVGDIPELLCLPWQVFKMLGNKESLDQIIVATPGLSSDPVALGESGCDSEDLRKGLIPDVEGRDPNLG